MGEQYVGFSSSLRPKKSSMLCGKAMTMSDGGNQLHELVVLISGMLRFSWGPHESRDFVAVKSERPILLHVCVYESPISSEASRLATRVSFKK